MSVEFKAWPKIPRHNGMGVVISEKIDGTNACVIVQDGEVVGAQSRKQIITVDNDNFGFAAWVDQNRAALAGLGDGYHYGEWAGPGIQKNPHNLTEKTFFLFNSGRWADERPPCCEVVRVLYAGPLSDDTVQNVMRELKERAEREGYKPEGVIIYHTSSRTLEKATFENSKGKWCE